MFITIKSTKTNLNQGTKFKKSAEKSKQVAEIFELKKHTLIILTIPKCY